jgi:hypothetical protein
MYFSDGFKLKVKFLELIPFKKMLFNGRLHNSFHCFLCKPANVATTNTSDCAVYVDYNEHRSHEVESLLELCVYLIPA